jgi:glutaredoxin
VPVTLYTSGWCTLCDQARDYLMVRGVAVQSVDIDADKAVYERLLTINKAASLPTFEVGGKPVIGFNPTELEAIIDTAAAGGP